MPNTIRSPLIGISLIALLGLGAEVHAQAANDVICNKCIGPSDVASKAFGTAKIDNKAVTSPKLASSAVTTVKIANQAVTTGKIQLLGVDEDRIADGAVTGAKVSGVLTIPAWGFTAVSPDSPLVGSSFGSSNGLARNSAAGTGYYRAPVALPAGTAIKRLHMNSFDRDSNNEVTLELAIINCTPECLPTPKYKLATGVAETPVVNILSSDILNEVIAPGPDFYYFLEVTLSGTGVGLYSVTVEYGSPTQQL